MYRKILNNYIINEFIKALIIALIIIILAYNIASYLYQKNISALYTTTNLVVDIAPNIKKDLAKLTDIDSFQEKGYIIGITNNSKDTSYKILLCGRKNDNLRLNISNNTLKNLSSYEYDGSCYTLVEAKSLKETTAMYEIKLFIPASSTISDYYASYELKVQEDSW